MKTFFAFLCLLPVSVFAQTDFKFKEVSHDFGQIAEGTQAKYEFVCKNVGTKTLTLSGAQPACGCTVSEFTKEPIAPGRTGKVTAIYNTSGRPGSFVKTVTVTVQGSTNAEVLTLRGTVVPASQVPAVDPEKVKTSARLELEKKRHNFGQIEKGKTMVVEMKVKNPGKSDLKITSLSSGCHCVGYSLSKSPITPGDSAVIEFRYTPRYVGKVNEWINVFSTDLATPQVNVVFGADVVESLTPVSEVKEEKTKTPFE
jgi:hypothetical protein